MSNGLQTFMRMANLYNPAQMQDNQPMPTELPTRRLIGEPEEQPTFQLPPDEEVTAEPEQSTLEAFRQSVLNPPKREHMTYPKNTLAGLQAALQIAAEPSPLEKNRVYVNGQAYQKQRVWTDPKTGEKKFITDVKNPSFMSQVMRAMPAAISSAPDILNQDYEDAVADWEMRNKGLSAAATAEANMALAGQRRATAQAIPAKVAQGERALDIKQMDAETRARLAELKDLPDSEKIRLLQEGKVSLEEIKAANQYTLQQLRGEQRTGQIAQQGAIRSGQIAQQGAITSRQIEQRGGIARDITRIRGEEARKTKQTPGTQGAGAANYPTQQRVAMQAKAAQIANDNPEWADFISINEEGFPEIEPPSWKYGSPDKDTYDQIYEAIYGVPRSKAAPINQPPKPPAKPPAKTAPPATGAVEMITPDGKGTRMVPANQIEVARKQGYKPKGSK